MSTAQPAGPQPISTETVRRYLAIGEGTRDALLDLLGGGWSFEDKRVLDFGCGPGRTLRHFVDEAREAEFWGADIDPST